MTAEGGEADVAFATGSEADTWGADHIGTIEQLFEELPRGRVVGGAHPDVRRILTTIALVAEGAECGKHQLCIRHIIVDGSLYLCLAFWCIDGLSSALGDIAGTIELGTLAAVPQLGKVDAFALEGGYGELLGNDGIATTHTRESGRLGIGAELDSTLAGTPNLVDRMRYLRITDIGLVGCIEEYQCIVLQSIVDKLTQLLLRDDCSRRVIRTAEVDHIDMTILGNLRDEVILCGDGHISHIAPATISIGTATTNHHIGIDVYRIDGVGDSYEVIPMEQFLEVTCVGLGSVVDEYLVGIEVDATRQEVVLDNGLAEKVITLFRAIATETGCSSHLVGSSVHRLDNGRTERLGDIANTQRDDISLRMHHFEGIHLLGDISEQIVVLEVEEMYVY